jgi:acetyl esterase/lipase
VPSTARVLLDLLARPARHRYGPQRPQRADLHLPAGDGPHPVTVVIHGGYWRAGFGKIACRAIAADLARRGMSAWNIEYRSVGRWQGGGWPATFEDVAAAIDHLAVLDEAAIDLDAVAAVGHSAGGQLALWAAARPSARVPIRRVVAQAGVCDLASAGDAAHDLMGGTPAEVPERYAAADPMRLLPLGVPTLLVHGAGDETVPVERSRRYAAAARAAGDPVELVEPSAGQHTAHIDPRSAAWHVAAEWLTRAAAPSASPLPAR